MNSIGRFFSKHWKKLLGGAVAVGGSFFPPLAVPAQLLGGLILGSDFQVGANIGTPIGKAAKSVADAHGALKPGDLAVLAEAAAAAQAAGVLEGSAGEVGHLLERLQALQPSNGAPQGPSKP